MLKQTLKKILALSLATVTLVTSAMPVSAETLKPKKSHTKAEITEIVDYYNGITDAWTFRPDGYVPVFSEGNHHSMAYAGWQMTELLQNTKGITAEQKADMKKAASKWKKSYVSESMICYYHRIWTEYMYVNYVEKYYDSKSSKNTASAYKARAKQTYNKVNTYITKKAKYNKKLAGELKNFNKKRLGIYNKAIDTWFYKMTKKQKAKYGSTIYTGDTQLGGMFTEYVESVFGKNKMSAVPYYLTNSKGSCSTAIDDYGDKDRYQTGTLKIWGYDLSKNAPCRIFWEHTPYKTW